MSRTLDELLSRRVHVRGLTTALARLLGACHVDIFQSLEYALKSRRRQRRHVVPLRRPSRLRR